MKLGGASLFLLMTTLSLNVWAGSAVEIGRCTDSHDSMDYSDHSIAYETTITYDSSSHLVEGREMTLLKSGESVFRSEFGGFVNSITFNQPNGSTTPDIVFSGTLSSSAGWNSAEGYKTLTINYNDPTVNPTGGPYAELGREYFGMVLAGKCTMNTKLIKKISTKL